MYLVADLGNTHAKFAKYDNSSLVEDLRMEYDKLQNVFSEVESNLFTNINGVIVSSVLEQNHWLSKRLIELFPSSIILSHQTKIPIENAYNTPQTLGKDRLANAVGASAIFPEQNVLCVDFGTCIKYDLVTSDNKYLGGGISPGTQLRYKALNVGTARLPLVNNLSKVSLIGKSTEESIMSGVINGIIAEINGITNQYTQNFENLKIIVCGGDHIHFVKGMKNGIFARPNLTLEGLLKILQFNEG